MQFNAKVKHVGQYKAYGDFFRVWEIETDIKDRGQVVERCFNELYYGEKLPEKGEWSVNIRYGSGAHSGDMGYYFRGYYTLQPTETGYLFKICEPFAD